MHLIFLILAALAVVAWCLAIAFILTTESFRWFDSRRWAVGSVDGVIASDDAVFVAESNHGRVYKFALDGTVIGWVDINGKPIRITRSGESIIVHYNSREWALDDPAFGVRDPGDVTAAIERTLWGHPLLVVRRADGNTKASLQPWYLTIVQSPYPGGVWPAAAIAFTLAAIWLRRRLRG